MSLLDVRGLSMAFGGLRAVQELDLAVERGEIAGLIGPNGSGKTTVFNLISGLYRATGGRIAFDDGRSRADRAFPARHHRAGGGAHLPEPAAVQPDERAGERAGRHALPHPRGPGRHPAGTARRARRAPADARNAARNCWPSSATGCCRARTTLRRPCRTRTGAGWRSPARSPPTPKLLLLDEPAAGHEPDREARAAGKTSSASAHAASAFS